VAVMAKKLLESGCCSGVRLCRINYFFRNGLKVVRVIFAAENEILTLLSARFWSELEINLFETCRMSGLKRS
jgi:hypothetical protein